ncbi:MAG: response regulator [Anaerolineae bacterium]
MALSGTVLVVDDLPAGRAALEGVLFGLGYELLMAENGAQALRLARNLSPDVVLLDVMMPDMDGYEVCQALRRDPRTAQIPVLMITALDDRAAKLLGLEVGADDFISKPFDRTELRTRIRTILQLNRYRRWLAEKAQFQWVIEHAVDGYVIVDQSDRIVYANVQARLLLNLSADRTEAAERTFLQVITEHYRLELDETWNGQSSPTEMLAHTRYLVRPESATSHPCWLAVWIFEQRPGLEGQRLIRLHDITLNMLEQRNERTFQGIVAHKLREPMAGVLGSLEMLAYDVQDLPIFTVNEMTQLALKSATRLRTVVDDILQYMSATSLISEGAPFVWTKLPELVAQISARLALAHVTVTVDAKAATVITPLSDKALEWILAEVLENAGKFHPQQAPRVEVRFDLDGVGHARLCVGDDGLTLSPEQLTQVWEPYYQAEKYFTGEVAGMGLGLALVASLVWAVNGACYMRNRVNGPGVMVQINLPTDDSAPRAAKRLSFPGAYLERY